MDYSIEDVPSDVKILIVDDEAYNRKLLHRILQQDNYDLYEATNGVEALEAVRSHEPDLILLDIMMPEMDGFEVTARLKHDKQTAHIPIIMVTALEDMASRVRGLDMGAEEFVCKPLNASEILIRVRNLLRLKRAGDIIKHHNSLLEEEVQARTDELRDSFVESIFTLMRAAEYRDDETGAHVRRISYYTRVLAEVLGMDDDFCNDIFYASAMHDIGKIGIPDRILLKPGSFEPAEWEIMKTHTTIGATILSGNSSPYLQLGEQIALGHHERWDGGGYPSGLAGDAIPLAARIMQLADVYDALRSERPYKKAFDHETSCKIITEGDGRTEPSHFDPAVLAAFQSRADTMNEIFEERRALEGL